MKKICIVLMLTALLVGVTACSKNSNTIETTIAQTKFELNNKTISVFDYKEPVDTSSNSKDDADIPIPYNNTDTYVSEMILVGEDRSSEYIIDGEDIVYKDNRFIGLATIIESLEQPYSKNNLINLIIKSYKYPKGDIYCRLEKNENTSDDTEEGVGSSVTLSDMLYGMNGYYSVVEKYEKGVSWRLLVCDSYNRSYINLYGCSDYLLYNGKGEATVYMDVYEPYNYEESTPESVSEEQESVSEEQESLSDEAYTEESNEN